MDSKSGGDMDRSLIEAKPEPFEGENLLQLASRLNEHIELIQSSRVSYPTRLRVPVRLRDSL